MFNKFTTSRVSKADFEILDGELIKTAAIKLPDGVSYDPDFFYMKVRGVSAGEYFGDNKNNDFFPELELIKGHKTFLTAHTFKNHENKDIKNAIGDVLAVEWNDRMKGVDILLRIDRRIAPTIVRGFEKGFMTDVSMGCRIDYSICSICGNKAKTKYEYCDHIKLMRGKILDDGKKVYEINIGPKFHDISAVLNGAERVAKVTGMIINGNKVAYEVPDSLEKVASFEEAVSQMGVEKVANIIEDNLEIFGVDEKLDKKAYVQKIANIKKEVQGKILEIAKGEFLNERAKDIDEISQMLRLLYTNYWDKSKCIGIAEQIKSIAIKKSLPIEVAFHQFLNVCDFAGIDLTPLEIHDIFSSLADIKTPDLRHLDVDMSGFNSFGIMNKIDGFVDHNNIEGINVPSMFRTLADNTIPGLQQILSKLQGVDHGSDGLKSIIIRIRKKVPSLNKDIAYNEMMDNVVKPLMSDRSNHRRFLMRRLSDVAEGKVTPKKENIKHFLPAQIANNDKLVKTASLAPYALSAMLHGIYENERVENLNNGNTEYGFSKFAAYIEGETIDNILNEYTVEKKSSYNPLIEHPKSWNRTRKMILPATLGMLAYSSAQRARVNNGENVNSVNRAIAENPAQAGLLAAVGVGAGSKAFRKGKKFISRKSEAVERNLAENYAGEDDSAYVEKLATINKELYDGDIFNDSEIDRMLSNKYNHNQIISMKYACVLNCDQRQDLAEEVLSKQSLTENDLEEYLKIAKDYIKIEIEKVADTKDVLTSAAGQMAFMPQGASVLALAPGNIVDGMILSKLGKKLQSDKPALNNKKIDA